MREILFRGKRVDDGKWVEGNLVCGKHFVSVDNEDAVVIIPKDCIFYPRNEITDQYEVDPATVGQYTGLTDKNGKRIFEGDIVEVNEWSVYHVLFDEGRGGWYPFACGDGCGCCEDETETTSCSVVIGNIHDNPELVKGAQE